MGKHDNSLVITAFGKEYPTYIDTHDDVLQVAKKISQLSDYRITNLKLQKIVYVAYMIYMGLTNGKKLFNNEIQALVYGPTVPNLYNHLKIYGAGIIPVKAFEGIPDLNDEEKLDIIKMVYQHLKHYKAEELTAFIYSEKSAFLKLFINGQYNIPINNDYLMDEYRARIK